MPQCLYCCTFLIDVNPRLVTYENGVRIIELVFPIGLLRILEPNTWEYQKMVNRSISRRQGTINCTKESKKIEDCREKVNFIVNNPILC